MEYQGKTGKAALYHGADTDFEIVEYPLTAPKPGKAVLKLLASGICGTDVHIHRGRLAVAPPLIIGHEFVGKIVDICEGQDGLRVGDRVIYNMASPCGKCKLCREGNQANCLHFEVANAHDPKDPPHFFGGYGEYCYANADAASLIRIPDEVDTLAAALFPCAGPTILHALKLGGVFQNRAANIENAVVQGAGPLGSFACLWLELCGVKRILLQCRSKNSTRAEMVRQLTHVEICTEEELRAMVSDGLSVDLAIECSGNPNAFLTGCEILRNRGIYLVPGQYSDSGNISFPPQLVTFKALQIIGSSQYDASDVAEYIRFLKENSALSPKLASLVKTYPLAEINDAMKAAEAHTYTKVVLV